MENNELKKNSELGVTSLVLGIISILFSLFWYITLSTGILAIILGKKSVNRVGSKLGKAGLITGIVGLSLFVFIYLSLIAIMIVSNYL